MTATSAAPGLTVKGTTTRAPIFKVAAEPIFERGVGETSIEKVRDRVRVSTSRIYHYFGSQHGLIWAVVQYQAAAAQCTTAKPAISTPSPP